MTTRKAILIPINENECVPLPADWFSKTRKFSPRIFQSVGAAMQLPDDDCSDIPERIQAPASGDKL